MKNIVIGLLALSVVFMGSLLFARQDATDGQKQISKTVSDTPATSTGSVINLANKGLSEVPKNLLDNHTVTMLDVSGNNLTGALPAEVRKLTNLEVLNASNNKLSGVPAEIGQLSKLRIINFADNNISGLPLELGNLNKLETLDLRGNPNISKSDISKIQTKIPNAKILTD